MSVMLAAEESSGGPVLDVNEVATVGVSVAFVVFGVIVAAGVLNNGIEGNAILGDSDLSVHVGVSPVANAGVLAIVE